MGGYLSLAYGKKYPDGLKGVILLDTKADADTIDARQVRLDNISLIEKEIKVILSKDDNIDQPTIGELMNRNEAIKAMMNGLIQKLIYRQGPKSENLGHVISKDIEAQKAVALTHSLSAMAGREESYTTLANLHIPILILVGSHDVITPIAAAQKMQKSAESKAKLCIIQNAGHLAIMEQTTDTLDSIHKWLVNLK